MVQVNDILSGQRSTRTVDSDVIADAAVLEAHRRLCGASTAAVATSDASGLAPGQRAIEGDCPICYDDFTAAQKVITHS